MQPRSDKRWLALAVRYLLPAVLAISGVVLSLAKDGGTSEAIAKGLVGAAAMVVAANVVIFVSLKATRRDLDRAAAQRSAGRGSDQINGRGPESR